MVLFSDLPEFDPEILIEDATKLKCPISGPAILVAEV